MAESQVGSLHAPLSDNVSILSHFSRAFRPAFRHRAGGKRNRESGAADFARLLFAGLAGPEEAPNVLPDPRENHDKTLHFLRTLLRILL
jgi:hypothetical protein